MKRLLLFLALFASPALADTVQSLTWNPVTKELQALTKQNGTKPFSTNRGVTDASSTCVGCVGEVVRSAVVNQAVSSASAAFQDTTSITLTAGDWDISMCAFISCNASTVGTRFQAFIGSVSGNNSTGQVSGDNLVDIFAALQNINVSGCIPNYRQNISATGTYYAKVAYVFTTAGACTASTRINARRAR